jgi:hypothetical protein
LKFKNDLQFGTEEQSINEGGAEATKGFSLA